MIKIGVLPQPSDPARLRALVGPAVAKRILLTGAKVSAQEALNVGLIDQIANSTMMETVEDVIAPALSAPMAQITGIKALIDG